MEGSLSALPTRCPSSDTVPQLHTQPAASRNTSIRRCAGTWKPSQSPVAGDKIPMWISESPLPESKSSPLYAECQYGPLNDPHPPQPTPPKNRKPNRKPGTLERPFPPFKKNQSSHQNKSIHLKSRLARRKGLSIESSLPVTLRATSNEFPSHLRN